MQAGNLGCQQAEVLHLDDVVGPELPGLEEVLAAIPLRFERVIYGFRPDRLNAGQIFHAAGPSANGWTIMAVHDSKESWQTNRKSRSDRADRCDRPRSCLLHYGDLGGSRARSHVADQLSRDVSLSAGLMAIHSA